MLVGITPLRWSRGIPDDQRRPITADRDSPLTGEGDCDSLSIIFTIMANNPPDIHAQELSNSPAALISASRRETL